MKTHLLDANVLIALVIQEHEHRARANRWLASVGTFAVCPVVQGALVRFLMRMGESGKTAAAVLGAVMDTPRCEFWADNVPYADVNLAPLRGHRQVTDSYLVALAEFRGGVLATLDAGLAAQHPHSSTLIS